MPVRDELKEFLRERRAMSGPPRGIDWKAKKTDWIDAVERLYHTIIDDILKDSLDEKLVRIERRRKNCEERHIGKYTIPELVVRIGDEEVVFSPKGVNVIGAAGRVDLIGRRGGVTIVREHAPATSKDGWSIVERRIPSPKLVPLSKESLLAALREIVSL